MEIVYVFLLLWGIDSATADSNDEESVAVVKIIQQKNDEFTFNRGDYYQSPFGYYISNLSDKQCERKSLLVADLTKPLNDVLKVNEIELGCSNG